MPSAKILEEKKKVVDDLTEKLKYPAGVLVNYSGITVNEDTGMRVKLREANVDYTVVKNTMMKFAIKNVGFEELDPVLFGNTSLAVCKDDQIAPARVIKEYADKFPNYFEIKGGFIDGKVISVSDINALASIPPLPILQAQLLGTMLAPITGLAVVLKQIAEKNGGTAEAAPEQDETAAEAEPEAAEAAETTADAAPETDETASDAPAEAEDAPAEAAAEAADAPVETAEAESEAAVENTAAEEASDETPAE